MISRIYTELRNVSVFNNDQWPDLISFFKPARSRSTAFGKCEVYFSDVEVATRCKDFDLAYVKTYTIDDIPDLLGKYIPTDVYLSVYICMMCLNLHIFHLHMTAIFEPFITWILSLEEKSIDHRINLAWCFKKNSNYADPIAGTI